MNYFRRHLLLFAIFSIPLLFLSCSKEKRQGLPKAVPAGGTLRICASAETEILDPQGILFLSDLSIASHIYEGLVGIGNDFNRPIPVLATRWEKYDGGKRIRFYLRKNVRFHDDPCFPAGKGRLFTAGDVVYTFQRLADPQLNFSNFYLFQGKIAGIDAFHNGQAASISGIRVLGPHTVEFVLTRPYFSFLKLLSTAPAFIVPKEAVTYYGANLAKHPVGTGPFRLVSWKQLEEIVLIKNEAYWGRDSLNNPIPYLKELRIRLISNPILSVSEFLKGSLNLLRTDEKTYNELLQRPRFTEQFKLALKTRDTAVRFFGVALDKKTPLSRSRSLREAVARTFNRVALKQAAANGVHLTHSLAPPSLLGRKDLDWFGYTPGIAQKMLRQEKLPAGMLPIAVSSNIESPDVQFICQAIRELGLPCKPDIHRVAYYRHIIRDRPDLFRVSFLPNYPDAEDYYALFYSKNARTTNLTAYHNSLYDRLFEEALLEQSAEKRQEKFYQLERILKRDVPAFYVSGGAPVFYLTPHFVHGLKLRNTFPDFRYVWIERHHVQKK